MELKNDTTGPPFVQFFEVRNLGPSDILAATLQIGLPVYTDDGVEIIELLKELTVTEGIADCQSIPLSSQEHHTTSFRYDGEPRTRVVIINCTTGHITSNDRVVIRLSARLSPKGVINVRSLLQAYQIWYDLYDPSPQTRLDMKPSWWRCKSIRNDLLYTIFKYNGIVYIYMLYIKIFKDQLK